MLTPALALLLCAPARVQEATPPAPRAQVPDAPEAGLSEGLRASLEGLDPALGGWAGEVLLGRVDGALHELGAALGGEREALAVARAIAAEELELGPSLGAPRVVREAAPFRVERVGPEDGAAPRPGSAAELAAEWTRCAELAGPAPRRVKVKVVGTDAGEGHGATELRVELVSRAGRVTQVVARARAGWTWEDPEEAPRLASFAWIDLERALGPPAALFQDVTMSVLGGQAFEAVVRPSLETWRARLDSTLGVGMLGHHGLALGDVDGDGLEDLYACQPGGLPNLLFLHREDGTTVEAGRAAGVDVLDASSAALLVDLDGDGDLDLALGAGDQLALFENDGQARFAPRRKLPAPGVTALAAADADRDGTVDLFVGSYLSPYDGRGTPMPYHDATNGSPNLLYANRGAFAFEDVSEAAGLRAGPPRFTFAASWEDFDRDGDQDLYVANDFGRNELLRNDGSGRFADVARELGVEDLSAGMGVTWADVDGDLWPDLYVSNMYSSAGNRVAFGRTFRPGADESERAEYQRHARGNSLFLNVGGRAFADVTGEAGVGMGRWAWGALFADLDNDARPDLVVPNGFVTNERADDL